jgi:hypothetical protein
MRYLCEYTDTFGGEANYAWVIREEISLPDQASDLSIVRAAKAALGLSGVRCRRSDLGELLELRPHGSCSVVFISPVY